MSLFTSWLRELKSRSSRSTAGPSKQRNAPTRFRTAQQGRFRPDLEGLEDRALLSLTAVAGANVNISRLAANQHESTIVVNPTNTQNLFASSNNDAGGGNFASFSTDGGLTWTGRQLGTGAAPAGDGLLAGNGDVQAAFDPFGNLYLTYISGPAATRVIAVVLSTDGGQTFTSLISLPATGTSTATRLDQPSIATGANSVWVSYRDNNNNIVAAGATVNGLGAANIGAFAPQTVPGSASGNFGDVAVGPTGQVMVTYQTGGGAGPGTIFINTDADGTGPGAFAATVNVTATQVGGARNIPAQSNSAGIDAEANLAWDRSGGVRNGRVYLVYTDAPNTTSNATKTYVRYSDSNGANWSSAIGVFDASANNSQFLPSISVDQTTGNVGVAWHDCRNDLGTGGAGDTNGTANDDAQLFAAFSDDGGNNFSANQQISTGTSNSAASEPAGAGFRNLGYGDYQKSDFVGGSFYRVWADNSNSTGDNPAGALRTMDIYTARVTLSSAPVSGIEGLSGKVTTGYESDTGPALGALGSGLYMAHAGKDGHLYFDFTSPAKPNWGPNAFDTGELTDEMPALATFGNRLFVAWTGTDDHLNVAIVTTDASGAPTGLTGKVTLGYESDEGPALAAFAGGLYLAHAGKDEHLYLDFISATKPNWGPNAFDTGELTEDAPALTASNNQLYIGWTGTDDHLNVAVVATGASGAPTGLGQKVTLGYESDVGPTLGFRNDALFLAHAGKDEHLYLDFTSAAKPNWGPNAFDTGELTESPPPLSSAMGRLFLGWTGTDDHLNVATVNTIASASSGLQNFPVVGGRVSVNGDQLGANYNDTVMVERSAAGGVRITLNGQVVEYAPGAITEISINTGGGSNTIIVQGNFALAPLTINGNGTDRLAFSGSLPATPVYTPSADGLPANGTLNVGSLVIHFTGLEFVQSVAPDITGVRFTAASVDENGEATLTGEFLDPGSLSAETITVNWGDGVTDAPVKLAAGARSFTLKHRYLDDNPTGTPFDFYDAIVTIKDDEDRSDTATARTTVNNVAPELRNVAVTSEIDENGVVTLSGDIVDPGTADTFKLIVDWGEGAPEEFTYPAGTTSFSETHRYLDDNPTNTPQDTYPIGLALRDDDTGEDTASTSTLVKNVAPVLSASATSSPSSNPGQEGVPTTISGAFTDVGTLDTHTATIDWDDGTVEPATITESGGSGSFTASHAYTSGGIYTVRITLRDDDTGEATATRTVFITGVGVHTLSDGRTALQVVGSAGGDNVSLNQEGNGTYKVIATFLADGQRSVPAAGIDVIQAVMLGGDDRVVLAGNVGIPAVLDGGLGDDTLNAGNTGSVVIGGGGDDSLGGGDSRDFLLGGTGLDRLNGGADDDVLVGGRTAYDSGSDDDKLANDLRLLRLLGEWNSVRLYEDRVANLRAGTGPVLAGTGLLLQQGTTVFDDLVADQLTGAAGRDWFFIDSPDLTPGRQADEFAD